MSKHRRDLSISDIEGLDKLYNYGERSTRVQYQPQHLATPATCLAMFLRRGDRLIDGTPISHVWHSRFTDTVQILPVGATVIKEYNPREYVEIYPSGWAVR